MKARLVSRLPTSPRKPPGSTRSRRVSGSATAMATAMISEAAVMSVEDGAPAERDFEQAAGQRAQHLRDHHDRDHQADHGADAVAAVEIADDGAAHHHAGGAAERLKEPRRDQLRQGFGEDAGRTRHHHQAETRQQHRAASELVRQRPHDDLRAGDADHVERHRHLRDRNVAPEGGGQHRQRRHQHIERNRRHAGHGDEQQQRGSRCRGAGVGSPGGLPITPCMLVRFRGVNRTVALSTLANTPVSECGYSVFGRRLNVVRERTRASRKR